MKKKAAKASSSQFDLNGDFCQNMWIVKPAAKSRGRGIECFTELEKILGYTESTKHPQAVSQWVVHKYMEVRYRAYSRMNTLKRALLQQQQDILFHVPCRRLHPDWSTTA